jgi:nicotinamidase/pyrazinamidase
MKTLIIVDAQNDFMPGGSLEIPNGDDIIPIINEIQPKFDLVAATQDWHPSSHKSFASNHEGRKVFERITWQGIEQVLWPDHCVQGTSGAAFHRELNMNQVESIFRKGMDENIDSYSGFFDNGHKKNTGLTGYLRDKGAHELYFCGFAADICVYFTLMDALNEGFKVNLLMNAVKALDENEFEKQKIKLRDDGVNLLNSIDNI